MTRYILKDVIFRANTKVDKDTTDLAYYVGGEYFTPGDVVVEQRGLIEGSTIGPMFYYGFRKGQFLLVSRNPHLKKAGVVDFDGICSEKTFVLESANPSILSPRYLPFVLQNDHFWEYAVANRHGSTNFFINWATLSSYEFELPCIEEQERIADILWALVKVKKSYELLLKTTDELVKTQFVEMIEKSDQTNTLGCFIKRCTPQRCGNRDLPVLSVTKEKAIVLQDERFDSTVVSRDKSNYIVVPKGFIVQGIHIDEGNFGLQNVVEEGIVSPAYKLWQITNHGVIPELLEFYLRSQQAIEYYSRNFQGSTVKRRQVIRTEDLLSMPTNIPSMPIQKAFWDLKLQSDKSKEELTQAINRIDDMVKAVLQV